MLGRSLRPHVRATSSAFRSSQGLIRGRWRPQPRSLKELRSGAASVWKIEETSLCPRKIDDEMSGDLGAQDTQLGAWTSALPSEPGPFKRLLRVLLSLVARPPIVPGYDEGEPPPEGAGGPGSTEASRTNAACRG
jgi:hypothetical protein